MSMRRRLPSWAGPPLLAALLSGVMSLIVCGVATVRTLGPVPDFPERWLKAWLAAWPVAFATMLVVGPAARRLVATVVAPSAAVAPPAAASASTPVTSIPSGNAQ